MADGVFLTFEGGEGAGKSTQVRRLAADLERSGIDVISTREPGGSPGAEDIRKLLVSGDVARWQPLTEVVLHYAARVEHVATVVRPALERGTWVICDRFHDSTIAYQGYGHGLEIELIDNLHQQLLDGFQPNLTMILDIPVDAGLARTGGRDGVEDRYERMDSEFHQRLRDGFLQIAAAEPERCAVIDAISSEDAVHRDVIACIKERLSIQLG